MRFRFIALAMASITLPTAAQATDLGDALSCFVTGVGTFSCNTPSNTVGAGTEFTIGNQPSNQYLGADFGLGTLSILALQNSSLGATILNFQDLTSPITSFSLAGTSGFSGFDASDLSLNGGLLSIDLRGTDNTAGGYINLSLGATGAVPEPATWAMMLLGFGLVGAGVRSAKRRTKLTVSYA